MDKPLIISAAITGGGPAKARSVYQPATPDEIVDSAVESWRAGAAIVHIHARDENGVTTSCPDAHQSLKRRIRDKNCDAIINFSAGDDGGKADHETRLALIRNSGAEIASLTCGSFNIGDRIYNNGPSYLRKAAALMNQESVRPEIEIADAGNLDTVHALIHEELILAPGLVQFAFGIRGAMPADPALLPILLRRLPRGFEWGVIYQGAQHQTYIEMNMAAFSCGGHVRTGFEDVVEKSTGVPARSNAELVEQWVKTADIWGRPVASPSTARAMLGIPQLMRE